MSAVQPKKQTISNRAETAQPLRETKVACAAGVKTKHVPTHIRQDSAANVHTARTHPNYAHPVHELWAKLSGTYSDKNPQPERKHQALTDVTRIFV